MTITLFADALVATLLVATIVTCYVLSKRIERLKADEGAMRQTIGALISATDTAERAIAGLKSTLNDCDRTLADRLRTAERYAADLAAQVEQTLRNTVAVLAGDGIGIACARGGGLHDATGGIIEDQGVIGTDRQARRQGHILRPRHEGSKGSPRQKCGGKQDQCGGGTGAKAPDQVQHDLFSIPQC